MSPGFLSPLILRLEFGANRVLTQGQKKETQVQAESDTFTGGQKTSDTGWPPTWKPFCRQQSS